jgi:hypothetical protein
VGSGSVLRLSGSDRSVLCRCSHIRPPRGGYPDNLYSLKVTVAAVIEGCQIAYTLHGTGSSRKDGTVILASAGVVSVPRAGKRQRAMVYRDGLLDSQVADGCILRRL